MRIILPSQPARRRRAALFRPQLTVAGHGPAGLRARVRGDGVTRGRAQPGVDGEAVVLAGSAGGVDGGWRVQLREAVGGQGDRPVLAVHHPVMEAAQQGGVVEVGRSAA
jgi:hypothetical protein